MAGKRFGPRFVMTWNWWAMYAVFRAGSQFAVAEPGQKAEADESLVWARKLLRKCKAWLAPALLRSSAHEMESRPGCSTNVESKVRFWFN